MTPKELFLKEYIDLCKKHGLMIAADADYFISDTGSNHSALGYQEVLIRYELKLEKGNG